MTDAKRSQFSDESCREDEWYWYNHEEDWRIFVADQGVTRSNRFNVGLETDLYESRYEDGRILGDTRIMVDEVVGYENAMARAAELIAEASELVQDRD